jgi:hypothetical protein
MRNTFNAEGAEERRETQRKNPLRSSAFLCVKWGLLLLPIVVASLLIAAPPPETTTARVKGFRVPQYFEAPHALQMKSLLEGAEAQPQPGGLIQIASFKLQMFDEQGETTMVVTAPRCIFDTSQQTVSSDGPLQLWTSDGKLLLEGEGFFWQHANRHLMISNHVHTTIRGTLNNSLMP